MTLAREILGVDGSIFLEAGTVLGKEEASALTEFGVGSVYVKASGPGMDGAAVLSRIDGYVRSFFDYVDPDNPGFVELYRIAVQRAVEAGKKGWTPPCERERRADDVEHLSDLFFKDQGSVQDLVKHETSLSSFPDTYFKLKQVLDNPAFSAADTARVVGADVGLSAKLLKLVNSPFFGLTGKVDSIEHAVSLVGAEELGTLALGVSAVKFFKDIPPELMDMEAFWRHSLRCAVFSRLLASKVNGLKADRFFTAGLLHDAGRLVMIKNMPYASVEAMLYARSNFVPLVDAENEIFGFDHAHVAALLLGEWNFPKELTSAISHHHEPLGGPSPMSAAVVQLADNLARAADISSGGMYLLPGMERRAWDMLGIDPSELRSLVLSHDNHLQDLMQVFFQQAG